MDNRSNETTVTEMAEILEWWVGRAISVPLAVALTLIDRIRARLTVRGQIRREIEDARRALDDIHLRSRRLQEIANRRRGDESLAEVLPDQLRWN